MKYPTVVTSSVALAAYLRAHDCSLEKVELSEYEERQEFLFSLNGMNVLLYHSRWLSTNEKLTCSMITNLLSEAATLYKCSTGGQA